MSLSLFSLNIEADRHLDTVHKYLATHAPDVVHLQEVYRVHAETWAQELGYHLSFAPHVDYQVTEHIFKPLGQWGIATLTKIKPAHCHLTYYSAPPHLLPTDYSTLKEGHPRAVIIVELPVNQHSYYFGNTHFTWAMPDVADLKQAEDLKRLDTIIADYPSLVLSGDFNASRTSLLYRTLNAHYPSRIPESVTTTLDPVYFRKPGIKLVVDHLFASTDYLTDGVKVVSGLSDHCGIVANITKT